MHGGCSTKVPENKLFARRWKYRLQRGESFRGTDLGESIYLENILKSKNDMGNVDLCAFRWLTLKVPRSNYVYKYVVHRSLRRFVPGSWNRSANTRTFPFIVGKKITQCRVCIRNIFIELEWWDALRNRGKANIYRRTGKISWDSIGWRFTCLYRKISEQRHRKVGTYTVEKFGAEANKTSPGLNRIGNAQ